HLVFLDARLRELRRLTFAATAPTVTADFLREPLTEQNDTNVAATLPPPDPPDYFTTQPARVQEFVRQYRALFNNRTNVVADNLPTSPAPRICGFRRTAYGEFVVVLYHDRYTAMVNVMEPIGAPRSVHVFFNLHVTLLDKLTLEERLRIRLDACSMHSYDSSHVQLLDTSQDGQHELFLLFKDR
ncbi:MAG: hypothetical protein N2595_10520, partial [bacterium]|nr:hypothetical protein [bacterium]